MAVTEAQAAARLNLGKMTAGQRAKDLARSLVNTHYWPPGFQMARLAAHEARAYHELRPYPWWQFANWKVEERGPLPRCLPLPRRIVRKGAKWLFGKPIQISIPANETLEKFMRESWQRNKMPTRMVTGATSGGIEGGVALKWSYDETANPKLSFDLLSVIEECRLFYDPHNSQKLLMARVQYPVFSPDDGQMYLYREEWTDEEEIHYLPQVAKMTNVWRRDGMGANVLYGTTPTVGNGTEPDLYDRWEMTSRGANPFGVIPVLPIRNIDTGGCYGAGDLWVDSGGGMFRVIDRMNLSYHIMDKSNQFDGERNVVFLDVELSPDTLDKPIQPGNPISAKSENAGEGTKGQVIELEARGQMRPHILEYAKELKQEILDTVGSVDIRNDEVTNKGNMTTAVLMQLYAPLVAATEEKHKTYGEDGVAKFLELCAIGLKNAGAKEPALASVSVDNEETHDVQIRWPGYFTPSEEEKTARAARVMDEYERKHMTEERVAEIIAQIEDVEDVTKFKEELDAERDTREADEADQFQAELDAKKPAASVP